MTWKDLLRSISSRERRFVAGVAGIAMLLSLIAPATGALVGAARGLHWNGVQVLAPGDAGVYFSYIAQAAKGALVLENRYTTEVLPATVNVFWQAVGYAAGLLRLTPIAAFYASRTLLIPAFAAVAYLLIAHFTEDVSRRRIAFAMFMFATGFGAYFAPLFPDSRLVAGSYEWPIDLWVGEAHAFTSMMFSPHFVASFTLILAVILALRLAWSADARRAVAHGTVAGFLGLILFQFHPFHAPTLYAVAGAYLLFETVRTRRIDRRWSSYLVFVALSAPAVWYHRLLANATPDAATLIEANLTLTPSPAQLVIGFGATGLLAAAALAKEWRSGDAGRFLVIWAGVQLALIHFPFTFQRRLIEGLSFPLCMLAASAILMFGQRFRPLHPRYVGAGTVLLSLVLFTPSSFAVIARNADAYLADDPPIFFHDDRQHALIEWLRTTSPEDAVFMSFMGAGSLIAGWGERAAYLGHWVNSGDVEEKRRETLRFLSEMTDAERLAFMATHGITHVFVGPEERRAARSFDGPSFALVYDDGIHSVYRPAK